MTMPTHGAQWPHFADTSFDAINFGQTQPSPGPSSNGRQSIDFGASQAYFGGFHGSGPTSPYSGGHPSPTQHFRFGHHSPSNLYAGGAHSPTHSFGGAHHSPTHQYGPGPSVSPISPGSAISGLDPISKLGFTSNRPSPQSQIASNGDSKPQYFPQPPSHEYPQEYQHQYLQQLSQHHAQAYHANLPYMQPHPTTYPGPSSQSMFSPQSAGFASGPEPHHLGSSAQQRRDDAAHRTAEIDRRNRLREEEKTRRTMQIQKQVQDGMDALQLEKDDAAHRSAELERRNRQREDDKEKRRLAIQKQVEDGIKAIQQEKQRERARVEADRDACRKWLSELQSVSVASTADAASQTVDLYAAIGRQLRGFWEESRPGASSQAHRDEVIADVQRAITRRWPGQGLQVAAFGSSVTGLLTETSDLDLVLLDPTRPCGVGTPLELRRDTNGFVRHTGGMPEWYSTGQIANALRNSNKFKTIVPISSANVPIVKMVHRKYDIPADININERFGLYNSQLIQAYANLQPHIVRPLIFFLKHWYSRRDLNDPAGKRGSMTFSSYTIALMALQVLQTEGILPNLQSPSLLKGLNIQPTFLYSRFKRLRRGKNARANSLEELAPPPQQYNVTFATGEMDLEPYKSRALQLAAGDAPADCANDKLSATDRLLGRMLVSFLRFYTQLDRRRQVVSVVHGAPLQRKSGSHPGHVLFDSASEDEGSSDPNEGDAGASDDPLRIASRDADARAALREEQKDVWAGEELVVQDPFIIDRNTSRNIKAASIERWQSTMQSAVALLGVQKQGGVGHAPQVPLKDAPLILDLCIPDAVRQELEAVDSSASGPVSTEARGETIEPWKLAEEAAALERKIAKQAAESLRKEKKKQARRAKATEARKLQEEAAMVEDMIDGINAGRVTGYASANVHELWRLRQDQDASTAKEPLAVPFTFSVSRPSGSAVPSATAKTDMNGAAPKQLGAQEAAISPTVSNKTDGSSESEDVDLVALRLEQAARVAES